MRNRLPIFAAAILSLVFVLAGCSPARDSRAQDTAIHKRTAGIVQHASAAQADIAAADKDTQAVAASPQLPTALKPPLTDAHTRHQAAAAALAPIAPAAAAINAAGDKQASDTAAAAKSDPTKFWLTLGIAAAIFGFVLLGLYKLSGSWAISGIGAGLATLTTLAIFAVISHWLWVLIAILVLGGIIYFIEHTYNTGATTGFWASIKKFLTNSWDTVETDAHDLLDKVEGKSAAAQSAQRPAAAGK